MIATIVKTTRRIAPTMKTIRNDFLTISDVVRLDKRSLFSPLMVTGSIPHIM